MEEDKKVWNMLRIGFWAMVGFILFSYFPFAFRYSTYITLLFYFGLLTISIMFTIIMSIIHLRRYKQKAFAITALVISSLFLLNILFFVMVGVIIGIMDWV